MKRKQNGKRGKAPAGRTVFCMGAALVCALFLTGGLIGERGRLVEEREREAKERLAGRVLRFHVLANSNSKKDQKLKMQVKEAALSYMKENMPKADEAEETKEWARAHLEELRAVSEEAVKKAGFSYPVKAEITSGDFPKKSYGDVTFPAGSYEALRISIGKAKGHNWWCCLYPNLCFTDAIHAVVPKEGKEQLKRTLDEDGYEMVTASSDFKIRWFFFGD